MKVAKMIVGMGGEIDLEQVVQQPMPRTDQPPPLPESDQPPLPPDEDEAAPPLPEDDPEDVVKPSMYTAADTEMMSLKPAGDNGKDSHRQTGSIDAEAQEGRDISAELGHRYDDREVRRNGSHDRGRDRISNQASVDARARESSRGVGRDREHYYQGRDFDRRDRDRDKDRDRERDRVRDADRGHDGDYGRRRDRDREDRDSRGRERDHRRDRYDDSRRYRR